MIDQLDTDGRESFERRAQIGREAIEIAAGQDYLELAEEDHETYATDAISDILTALVGIAGTTVVSPGGSCQIVLDGATVETARELLNRALDSWTGDAEDYAIERDPEPGEYGHEEPDAEASAFGIYAAIKAVEALKAETEREQIAGPVADVLAQEIRLTKPDGDPTFTGSRAEAEERVGKMTDAELAVEWERVSDSYSYWETAESEDHEWYDTATGELQAFDRTLAALHEQASAFEAAIEPVRAQVKDALEGDSNDAKHDALAAVAAELGVRYTPHDDLDG